MKIGIHSDLHTEYSLCKIANLAELDLLVLAGDIGDLQSVDILFEQIRKDVQNLPILYVLGNHEFYGLHYPEAKEQYRKLCQKHKVTLLDNETHTVGNIVFLGTTLWTDFNLDRSQLQSMYWAQHHVGDFFAIRSSQASSQTSLFTPQAMLIEFQKAYNFLSSELQKAKEADLTTVVVTHFLPALELVAEEFTQKPGGFMRSAYWGSHLSELFSHADYWVYGHSHTNIQTKATNALTQFLCNQRGYSKVFNESEPNNYQHAYVIEVC